MKILWDINVETEHVTVHRQPDIVIFEKKEKNALPIAIAIPGDVRVVKTEDKKVTKYQCFASEVKRLW